MCIKNTLFNTNTFLRRGKGEDSNGMALNKKKKKKKKKSLKFFKNKQKGSCFFFFFFFFFFLMIRYNNYLIK